MDAHWGWGPDTWDPLLYFSLLCVDLKTSKLGSFFKDQRDPLMSPKISLKFFKLYFFILKFLVNQLSFCSSEV